MCRISPVSLSFCSGEGGGAVRQNVSGGTGRKKGERRKARPSFPQRGSPPSSFRDKIRSRKRPRSRVEIRLSVIARVCVFVRYNTLSAAFCCVDITRGRVLPHKQKQWMFYTLHCFRYLQDIDKSRLILRPSAIFVPPEGGGASRRD